MNALVDPNAAHAVYAPSSAHRWTVCTASATAIAALPAAEEGEEAAEGTRAHDEIERVLGPLCETSFVKDPMPYPQSNDVDPDHPAAYGVALVVAYVRNLVNATPGGGRMWVEQRVHLTEQIWGRCDVAHWDAASATLTIVDYKNGFVGVDAEENEQLRIYAAACIATHKIPAKWIRLVVVQPNDFRPLPRVKQWMESAESLFAFAERIAAIPNYLPWEQGEGQNASGPARPRLEFVAGETCKYCPLFGRCPASADVLTRLSVMLANPPDAVRPDQVAMFKACEKPISDWFKSLDKAATKAALTGSVPPGMGLFTAVKHRVWSDEQEARRQIVSHLGVEALEAPTPAQAEKLGMDKAAVGALASTPEGGPVLAFASDKRKPWAPKSAAQMFKDIPGVSE